MLSLSVFPEMSKGLTQYLIKFFKETSCECLTAVTVVAEVLTKYMYDLKKDELKRVVEQSITSISYIIDDKKKAKLLEINLKIYEAYDDVIALIKLGIITIEYNNDSIDSKVIAERVKKFRAKLLVAGEIKIEYDMYESLAQNINDEEFEEINWTDPLASSIISDQSNIVLKLSPQDKDLFMLPADNMSPRLRDQIISECQDLISNYNSLNKEFSEKDLIIKQHEKKWIADVDEQIKITKDIFSILCLIWENHNFTENHMRKEVSEGAYMSEVILPLIKTVLPIKRGVRLTSAEKQSKACAWRRREEGKKFGLKPDLMTIVKNPNALEFEVMYLECSRILSEGKKLKDDEIKLYRECNTGMDFAHAGCDLSTEFGIIGIQIAGEKIFLNVLIRDNSNITRYFHLCEAKIPFKVCNSDEIIKLVNLLLTFRNVITVNMNIVKASTKKQRRKKNTNTNSTMPSPKKKK